MAAALLYRGLDGATEHCAQSALCGSGQRSKLLEGGAATQYGGGAGLDQARCNGPLGTSFLGFLSLSTLSASILFRPILTTRRRLF